VYTAYRDSGWQSSSDWLGTHPSTQEKKRKKRPFPEVIAFARSMHLQSKTDWFHWAKSGDRPDDIPANPADSYEGEGWQDWPHFLGTTNKKAGEVVYRDFPEAREWARSRALRSQDEWKALTKSGRLPLDIPASPWHVYRHRGWTTVGDWLGKGEHHSKNKQWRNFPAARDWARAQRLRDGREWQALCRSGKFPEDIPAMPGRVYKGLGWISMGDWLGTDAIAPYKRQFKNFEEARDVVRAHCFPTKTEYEAWARSDERPSDIPALPSRTYANAGWSGWGDWLGVHNRWNKTSLLAFVSSIVPLLNRFQPSEIYAILRQNGCISAVGSLAESSPLKQLIQAALHQDKKGIEQSLHDLGLEELDDAEIQPSATAAESDLIAETVVPLLDDDAGLPDLAPGDILSGLDDLERSVVMSDTETIEFLITKAVGRLWSRVLRSENLEKDLAELRSHNAATYGSRVRERFLDQFNGAKSLPIPEGYSFRKKGEPQLPNLMQRLIAYRVAVDKRVGNWSGTGAGKTLGAILASRALDAKLTVIVALNNAMLDLKSGWAAEILNAFPNSHVIIKERGRLDLDPTNPNYLLLNYEAFQLQDSQAFVNVDSGPQDRLHRAR
jgi:hypothetical protein